MYFSLYIYKSGLCLTGKRFRCGSFPYLFGHFARSFFSGPLSVPTISVCPLISLALSPNRPIDRSYRIDHLFFLSLALSDFSIDYSVRGFRSLFSTLFFTRSFSRAEALSMEQQEICVRHDRILQLSFVLFCFCAFGYSLSHGNRTQHNGPDRPTGGFSSSFVCGSFTRRSTTCIALFRARPPLQLRSLCIRGCRQRESTLFLFNKTDLRDDGTKWRALKIRTAQRDSSGGAALAKATPMRLFLFASRYYEDLRGERDRQQFCHGISANNP